MDQTQKHLSFIVMQLKKMDFDKTKKNQIFINIKNSYCDKNLKIKLWQNWTTPIVTNLNLKFYKNTKLILSQISRTQIETKLKLWQLKFSNCDKTRTINLWQDLNSDKTQNIKLWQLKLWKLKLSHCDKTQISNCDLRGCFWF